MERWAGRVAVVTGASSGIGEAIAKELTKHGMKVAALARRAERLQELQEKTKNYKGKMFIFQCDVSNEQEIEATMKNIVTKVGPVSVLINNAGILLPMSLADTSKGSCRKLYETNIIGLVTMSQHVVEIMRKHDISDGHIININSIAGHSSVHREGLGNYCASKNAVTVLTESLKNELSSLKLSTRVTSVSPGLVKTEIIGGIKVSDKWPILDPEDIVEGIIFVLSLKPHINISEITIEPTGGIRGGLMK